VSTGSSTDGCRAEIHPCMNYGLPNPTIFIATADGGAAYNPTAGQISTALPPRQMQVAVRLAF